MSTIQYSIPYDRNLANAIYTDAMARMYGLVALGIATTAAAIWVGHAAGIGDVVFALGWIGMLLFFGIVFGTLYAAGAVVRRGNIALGVVLYLGFATLWGMFLSPILVTYTSETIGLAFLLTAVLFGSMCAIGMTTKRDLTKLGPMLLVGLIGVIVVSFVNILLIGSSALFLLINIVLVPIFLGLTVWETKQTKELAQEAAMVGDDKAATQVAVIGAIGLYLNAMNLFIILLNLLGFASDD